MIPEIVLTPPLLVALTWLSWYDLRCLRLPDIGTLSLIAGGLLHTQLPGTLSFQDALTGAAAGFSIFWVVGAIHFRLRRREGLGLGDAKLFAAAGAWLGWETLPLLLGLASLSALAWLLTMPGRRDLPFAFGPWLALAFATLWLARLAWT